MPFDSTSIESSIDTYPPIHDGENDDLYNSDYDSDDDDYEVFERHFFFWEDQIYSL